jgi:hypothetical protein
MDTPWESIVAYEHIVNNFKIHQSNPLVSLAQLGERQTEAQSLNLEVSRSIRERDNTQCLA